MEEAKEIRAVIAGQPLNKGWIGEEEDFSGGR
jgi:hypothetical protein